MRSITLNRVHWALLISAVLFATHIPQISAQEEGGDAPLGDVARSFRKKPVAADAVIDNDNLSKVVDDAESRHAAGSSPVFSLDPGGKKFRVSSPDVTCSLSFSGKTSALLSDPIAMDELPRTELAKLNGPASIDGDSLQVSMHNGTAWDLREIVIGLTIVRHVDGGDTASSLGPARIIPAVAGGSQPAQDSFQKQPDVTLLLRVKGSAAPSATAVFRTSLNFALFPDQEWHWAIVKAKGIPPQAAPNTLTQSEQSAAQPYKNPDEAGTQILRNPPALSEPPTR